MTGGSPALRVSRDRGAAADVTVTVDGQPRGEVWSAIGGSSAFLSALANAARRARAQLPAGSRPQRLASVLIDAGVDALDGAFARAAANLGRSDRVPLWVRDLVTGFGDAEPGPLGLHQPADAIPAGPLALLDAADVRPRIEVVVGRGFREQRADQRREVCELLCWLAEVCSVRVVASLPLQRWLLHEHRPDLPAEFSECCSAGGDAATVDDVEAAVAAARERYDPDGSAVALLRSLADEPGATAGQQALATALPVSAARVSQLLGDLEERGLIERYRRRDRKLAELRTAGRKLIETLDEEIGRQRRLDAEFSETGQHSSKSRGNTRAHGEGETGGRVGGGTGAADGGRWSYGWLPRSWHRATAAAARPGAVVAAEAPVADPEGDERVRWASYDDDRDEVVVACRAGGPLPYTVSTALALASPALLRQALPPSRLADLDLQESATMLRDARCIGALSEEAAADPETLLDALIEWGLSIEELTTTLHAGESEDRDGLRSEIMRSAHGLAGTIVHLLDEAGADVVRELQVPAHLDHDRLAELAEAVALGTAIQSHWGPFAFFRQVYESREAKRETAILTDGDAADPYGDLIGGVVLRGPDAHRLAHHVEGWLTGPREPHDDAPELAVPVPVRAAGREAIAETAARVCSAKNLSPTREAVSILHAVCGSPWAVADALGHLSREDQPRDLALDELRVALARLDPARVLPGTRPTAARLLQALCRTERALTQAELADAAGISERSVRRTIDLLAALDLARETEQGWRLTLPTTDERHAGGPRPAPLADEGVAAQDCVYDVVLALVDGAERLGDPADPIGRLWTTPGYTWSRLRAACPGVGGWLRAARALCDAPDRPATTVVVGPEIEQQPVVDEQHSPPTSSDLTTELTT